MSEEFDETCYGLFAWLGLIVGSAIIGLLLAWPLLWCWNAVMPYLFALPTLTWGKAWCLYFLSNLLVKSSLVEKKRR